MKCESKKNRVSLKYTLLVQSSLGSYLLEYVFIPSKQGEYPRKMTTWDPGNRSAGIYQEEGEENFQGGSCSVGVGSML